MHTFDEMEPGYFGVTLVLDPHGGCLYICIKTDGSKSRPCIDREIRMEYKIIEVGIPALNAKDDRLKVSRCRALESISARHLYRVSD